MLIFERSVSGRSNGAQTGHTAVAVTDIPASLLCTEVPGLPEVSVMSTIVLPYRLPVLVTNLRSDLNSSSKPLLTRTTSSRGKNTSRSLYLRWLRRKSDEQTVTAEVVLDQDRSHVRFLLVVYCHAASGVLATEHDFRRTYLTY